MVTTRPTAPSYIIKRPRLTKLLDESEARIILLCAPAGYGKTTLAREWVDDNALWYSVRPTDCDVAAFAGGLAELFVESWGTTNSDPVESVRSLAVRGLPAKSLARPLAAAAVSGATLVLDDYHYAAENQEADGLLHELALRSSLRIVLTSRVRPLWATGRSMVYGDVLLVGADELAFTEDETKSALACATGSKDSDLLSIVGGWPAVIGMAAVQGSTSDLSRMLAPRALYDFFAEELFGSAAPLVQQSMLKLAAGGDSSIDVARDLIGESFDEVIRDATARGFIRRERERPLVMHPLLRDFFLTRLGELGQEQVESVVQPVVRRLNDGHYWDECLTLLRRFPDVELIPKTLSAAMLHLLASGRLATIEQWVDLARREHVDHPIVLLAEAEVAVCQGRNDHAQALALRAAPSLESTDLAAEAYLTAARAAHLADDLIAAAQHAEHAESLGADTKIRREALWLAFVSAHESGSPEAARYLQSLAGLKGTDPELALRVACAQALQAHEHGRTLEAVTICEQAEGLLPHLRDPLQTTGFLNIFAHACYAGARFEQSLELADRLIDEAEASGLDFPLSYGLLNRACALVGTRRLLAARRVLNDLDKQQDVNAHIVGNAIVCTAKLHIAAGDLDRAATVLDVETPPLTNTPLAAELHGYRGLVDASRGLFDTAEAAFSRAEGSHYTDAATTVALGRAVISLARNLRNARRAAADTVEAMMITGNREALVTAMRAFPHLISACADHPVTRQLTPLLVASHDVRLGRRFGLTMPREAAKGGRLSNRENDVYELIAQGRSNKQIAHALFISESTTKVHVRHIFEKLGVRSRAEVAALRTEGDDLGER